MDPSRVVIIIYMLHIHIHNFQSALRYNSICYVNFRKSTVGKGDKDQKRDFPGKKIRALESVDIQRAVTFIRCKRARCEFMPKAIEYLFDKTQ